MGPIWFHCIFFAGFLYVSKFIMKYTLQYTLFVIIALVLIVIVAIVERKKTPVFYYLLSEFGTIFLGIKFIILEKSSQFQENYQTT